MAGAAAGITVGVLADRGSRPLHPARCAVGGAVVGPAAVEVEKPETHRRRSYEYMQLPNGMQVILASDATCDKAAAALAVGVGRLHEPKDMPGLAHFCEHMLFLGTKAFPDEAEYKRFIKGHGGNCNAATSDNYTCYMFDVAPDFLAGALDRFSQFFRSPLFTPSATEREINAVDSEHSMRITDDGRRSYAALLLDANPGHPLHWGSGNAKSLRDAPRARGEDPHARVVQFYNENYTAEDMTLAVLGRQPLPELRRMVEERFAEVRRTGRRALRGDRHGGDEPAIKAGDFAGLVLRVPSKDKRTVAFAWQLPKYQVPLWSSKPGAYASHLIGHEGEGSLLSALKANGFATALSAGVDDFGCFSHFEIEVTLTEHGLEHVKEVGEFIFTYLQLVRASRVQPWVLDEMKQLKEVKFRFADDKQPYDLVSTLARNLQHFPPRTVLSAPVKLASPDPSAAAEVLDLLTVDGVRVELVGKRFADQCVDADPWYSGRYARLPLHADWREAWCRAAATGGAGGGAGGERGMRLPGPNVFIPQDLSLRPAAQQASSTAPQELATPPPGVARAFHRQDDRFLQPKAAVAFRIHSPAAAADPASYMRCQLWCASVEEELNEFAYDAAQAGLSYSLDVAPGGLTLFVSGFSDKLPTLLEIVARRMREVSEVKPGTFAIVRDRAERNLQNLALKQRPCDLAGRKSRELQHSLAFTVEDRRAALEQMGPAALDGESGRLLDECRVEALVTGNVAAADAAAIAGLGGSELRRAREPEALPVRAEMELPPGYTVWRINGPNKEERNNNVRLEMQLPLDSDNFVYTSLLVRILNPKFFENLRTKQQLGYIVQMGCVENECLLSVACTVQTEYPTEYVRGQIDAFLDEYLSWVENELDEAEFARQRAGLASNLAEAPKNLFEEFSRYWVEVARQRFDFGRRERRRLAVERAELQALRRFVREKVRLAPRLYVEVQSTAPGTPKASPSPSTARVPDQVWGSAEEAWDFRRSSATWRSPSPGGGEALSAPAAKL